MVDPLLFEQYSLMPPLISDLRRTNPWWIGEPLPRLPLTRRHLVEQIHSRLRLRLAPIVVVRGPRQIGKTTAQLQVLQDLLGQGVQPSHILRVQCDELPGLNAIRKEEPILRIVDWFERMVLKKTLSAAAHSNEPTYLFFDEVQNLESWAEQLKFLVDHSTTQVVVTGSSALRIEIGRDSLAGRVTTIPAGTLSLTEIASFRHIDAGKPFHKDNGLAPLTQRSFWLELREHGRTLSKARDDAFAAFSDRGGYPLVHERPDVAWETVADQLNETVIRRVIQHDLRIGDRGRKRDAPLLEELFKLACRYIGQAPGSQLLAREAQRSLGANVGPQRVNQYLRFLSETLLLRLVEPLEIRLKRKRGYPKICLADHGLRASWLQEKIPIDPRMLERQPHLTMLAGHVAESVVGATLLTIHNLDLNTCPPKTNQPEVDFVLGVGVNRVPLEVKYQRTIDPLRDTDGLRSFIENASNNAGFGLLVTQADSDDVFDPRIVSLPLSTLMLLR